MSTAAVLSSSSSRNQSERPWTLTAAIWLTVINGLGTILPLPFIAGDVPGVAVVLSIVFGVVVLAGAWAMWRGSKWAAVVVFVLTAINFVFSIPGAFAAPTLTLRILTGVGAPLLLITCVLLVMRQTRRALH